LKYQETELKVFARFRVDDLNTGGRNYLGGRRLLYDVTNLCKGHLRVAQQNVARLRETSDGAIFVQGIYPGKTEIKVTFYNVEMMVFNNFASVIFFIYTCGLWIKISGSHR